MGYISRKRRTTSSTSSSVTFAGFLVSFNRCTITDSLRASKPCRLPAFLLQFAVVWRAVCHSTECSADMLAHVVTQSSSRTSARLLLQSLHWLPIRERISHEVATLTFKARRMSSPPYLNSLLNDHVSSRTLRPSSTPRLIIPRTRTELAKRAFSVACTCSGRCC